MTSSPKQENSPRGWPHLIPELSDEVKQACVDGVYEICKPSVSMYKFEYNHKEPVDAIQLHCQSLYTRRPNEVHKCNSLVKTIIGEGSGCQTELIECGRCRTSYLVTTDYNSNGDVDITVSVWDLGRNLKQYAELKRDKDHRIWVNFNS